MDKQKPQQQQASVKTSNKPDARHNIMVPLETLEPLPMFESLRVFDTSSEIKMQSIGSDSNNASPKKVVSQYDDALMNADLSMLGVGSEQTAKSASAASAQQEVAFMSPEELETLHPNQRKEYKLKILNDIRKRLSSEDDQERYEALQQFSYYIDDNNIVLLNKLVTDKNIYIKEEIIKQVSKFKNNNAISILDALKRDVDPNISSRALDALSIIDPRYAKPVTTVDKKVEVQTEVEQPKEEKGGISSIFKKI